MTTADLPVLGRFLRGDAPRSSRYVTEFYDLRNEATQVSSTIKAYIEAGDQKRAERLERENAWLLGPRVRSKTATAGFMHANVRAMNKVADTASRARNQAEEFMASDASGAAKRERQDAVTKARNDEMKRMVRRLREAQRQ